MWKIAYYEEGRWIIAHDEKRNESESRSAARLIVGAGRCDAAAYWLCGWPKTLHITTDGGVFITPSEIDEIRNIIAHD